MTATITWYDGFDEQIATPCITFANGCLTATVTDDDNVSEPRELGGERVHVSSDGRAVLVLYFENENRIYEEIDGDEVDIYKNGDIRTPNATYTHPLRWALL